MSSVRRCWGKAINGLLAVLGVLALTGNAGAKDAAAEPGGRTLSVRLENGLEVVLSEAREQPTFSLGLRYRVGSSSDPKELSELAHLVEHLSVGFSKNVPGNHDQLAEEAGVDSNAFTGLDATTYVSRGNVGALERVLWLERQRMAFTLENLSARGVELERQTLDNERSSVRADDEAGLYWDFASGALYDSDHPYAPRTERGCILHCRLQHAEWLMQRGYRPDNARLVIVGDFDADATLGMVRRLFGPIRNPDVALPALAHGPPRAGFRRVTIAAPVERPSLQLLWAVPDALVGRRPDFQVLDAALGAVLEHELVNLAGFATDVDVSLLDFELGGLWAIHVQLLPGVDPKGVEPRILARLARLRQKPPPIRVAHQDALMALLQRWDAPSSRVMLLLREESFGSTRAKAIAELTRVTQEGVAGLLRAISGQPNLSVSLRRAVDAPKRGELYREAT